jgi:hypothetical protein
MTVPGDRRAFNWTWLIHLTIGIGLGAAIPILDYRIILSQKNAEIDGRLDVIHARLDKLELYEQAIRDNMGRLDNLDKRLDRIEINIATIKNVTVYGSMKKAPKLPGEH